MKHYFSVFAHHHIALIILLFLATLSLFLPISSWAANETGAGDELISMTVKDEPLGDVLYKVAIATGYDISLDNKWQNYRVTASLEKVSLHKGLKRILRNLNSIIIYVSSKKIKIIIYDKTASGEASYTPPAEKPLDRSYRPSEHRLPASQVLEKEGSSGTDEGSFDNPIVSGQESEISTLAGEGEEKTKPESLKAEPNEGVNKDFEDKSSEESSEQDTQSESKYE